MVWLGLWLAVCVFAFLGMFTGYMHPRGVTEYFFTGLFYCLNVGFAFFICGIIAYGIGALFPNSPVESERRTLVAIRDKDGVSGQFFLGSGTINSQPYYFYYQKAADGALKPGKVLANGSVRVYEEDREDAEMVVWVWRTTSSWIWLVGIPHDGEEWSYDFHVPKGTIKTGFSM